MSEHGSKTRESELLEALEDAHRVLNHPVKAGRVQYVYFPSRIDDLLAQISAVLRKAKGQS